MNLRSAKKSSSTLGSSDTLPRTALARGKLPAKLFTPRPIYSSKIFGRDSFDTVSENQPRCSQLQHAPVWGNAHLPTFNHWAQHKRARNVYPDFFVATRALKSIVALTKPFPRRRNIRFRCLRSNFFRLCGRRIFEEVVKSVTVSVVRLIRFFFYLSFLSTYTVQPPIELNYLVSAGQLSASITPLTTR